jgi:DNA damage-binding protein 1
MTHLLVSWRAPATSRGYSDAETSRGFLDGDFLSTFLELLPGSSKIGQIMEGGNEAERLDVGYERYQRLLESIQAVY